MTHPVPTRRLLDMLQDAGQLVATRGALPPVVTGLTDDSRSVVPGTAFVAVRERAMAALHRGAQ